MAIGPSTYYFTILEGVRFFKSVTQIGERGLIKMLGYIFFYRFSKLKILFNNLTFCYIGWNTNNLIHIFHFLGGGLSKKVMLIDRWGSNPQKVTSCVDVPSYKIYFFLKSDQYYLLVTGVIESLKLGFGNFRPWSSKFPFMSKK